MKKFQTLGKMPFFKMGWIFFESNRLFHKNYKHTALTINSKPHLITPRLYIFRGDGLKIFIPTWNTGIEVYRPYGVIGGKNHCIYLQAIGGHKWKDHCIYVSDIYV